MAHSVPRGGRGCRHILCHLATALPLLSSDTDVGMSLQYDMTTSLDCASGPVSF
eukprot:SAG31_NODE_39390_length_288_cov_1.359788_1_plen_53_part_10